MNIPTETVNGLSLEPDPKQDGGYLIRTAGWVAQFAHVSVGPVRCGQIEDGVALDLCDCQSPNRCQWHPGGVISYRDLEAIYFAARAARGLS